jgi:tetratricopeptide (TPR) repeat protein
MLAFADMVVAEVGFRVARLGGVDVRDASHAVYALQTAAADPNLNKRSLRLRVRAVPAGRLIRVQASVSEGPSSVLLWSGQKIVDPYASDAGERVGFGQLVNDLTSALYRVVGAAPPHANADERAAIAVYQAIAGGNLRSREGLREAERLLIEASDLYGTPTLSAWRALVKGWRVIERDVDANAGLEEAFGLARQALDADALDPTALTVAAELSDIRGGPFDAVDLAQTAVHLDSIDAFAAGGFAKALMRRGANERAHAEALRATRLASGHRDQAWWKMLCCLTAVHCARYDEALRYAKAAHDLAPSFRPPMRFLVGLYFHAGDEEGVVRTAGRLKRVEPDFSAAALKDPDYPLRLRGTPLLDVADAGLF